MSIADVGHEKLRLHVAGANGQVGVEVSAFLSMWRGCEVVPITRSSYGSIVLRRLGMACRHGRMVEEQHARSILADCDIVADFGWPQLTVGRIEALARQVRNVVRYARPGAPYVFISTQSVYALDPEVAKFSAYRISKLHAEKVALEEGRKVGRPVYVLRLGEVHGPLQRVSRSLAAGFRPDTAYVPDLKSYTVFTYSIAEALVHIAQGRERPGIYTLFSSPEWTWGEIHRYYSEWTSVPATFIAEPPAIARSSMATRFLRSVACWARSEAMRKKDLIENLAMTVAPERMRQVRLRHYRRTAAAEIAQWLLESRWQPYGQRVEVPGQRLCSLTDVRPFILKTNREMKARFEALSPSSSTC